MNTRVVQLILGVQGKNLPEFQRAFNEDRVPYSGLTPWHHGHFNVTFWVFQVSFPQKGVRESL